MGIKINPIPEAGDNKIEANTKAETAPEAPKLMYQELLTMLEYLIKTELYSSPIDYSPLVDINTKILKLTDDLELRLLISECNLYFNYD